MGHSPIDLHTHDMLDFFLNLVIGPELAPPVHVYFSLPVLYIFFYDIFPCSGWHWRGDSDGEEGECHQM